MSEEIRKARMNALLSMGPLELRTCGSSHRGSRPEWPIAGELEGRV